MIVHKLPWFGVEIPVCNIVTVVVLGTEFGGIMVSTTERTSKNNNDSNITTSEMFEGTGNDRKKVRKPRGDMTDYNASLDNI